MKTLALQDGDLVYKNGDFQLIEGVDEVNQCIEIDLGTNQGDWDLNLLKGTDQSLLFDKSTDEQARAEIFRVLGNEERIESINSVEIISDTVNRVRKIHFDITLETGETLQREVNLDVGQ